MTEPNLDPRWRVHVGPDMVSRVITDGCTKDEEWALTVIEISRSLEPEEQAPLGTMLLRAISAAWRVASLA